MSLNLICENILDGNNLQENLEELGTLLRDEDFRRDCTIKQTIQPILELVNEYPMEILRILINYTADNNDNRLFMLSGEQCVQNFWNSVTASGNVGSEVAIRLMILIVQFVRADEDTKKILIEELKEKEVIDWVWEYYRARVDTHSELIDGPIEVLAEFSQVFPGSIAIEQFDLVLTGLGNLLTAKCDDDVEDVVQAHTQLLVNVTAVEDSSLPFPETRIMECLELVDDDLKASRSIRRDLFAVLGGIHSFPSYSNYDNIEDSISIISKGANGYAVAAAAISLGNCVHDATTKKSIIERVESISSTEEIGRNILQFPFNDVVQLQSFHFFNNFMTEDLAKGIINSKNLAALLKTTIVIVDNYQYYKEIGQIYLKFLAKLINLGFVTDRESDITIFNSTWDYLNNLEDYCEAKMLLLQATCIRKESLTNFQSYARPLLDTLLDLGSSAVTAQELLMKLKTLAVVFQTVEINVMESIYSNDSLKKDFSSKLTIFYSQLLQAISEEPSNPNEPVYKAITNNSKFLAAAGMKKISPLEARNPHKVFELKELCTKILKRSLR